MTLIDIRSAAKTEYQERMKARLNLVPTIETLMLEGKPITQEDLDKIQANPHNYENRERVPEPLLVYADLWHELTGLEMLKMDLASHVEIFHEWKDRAFQPEHIRGAWAEAKQRNILIGHPRALTITAKGVQASAKPALSQINKSALERTQKMLEEKYNEKPFVPRPTNLPRPKGI